MEVDREDPDLQRDPEDPDREATEPPDLQLDPEDPEGTVEAARLEKEKDRKICE